MSFDDFWRAYPRKVAKGAARKAYEKALFLADESEILDGLDRFRAAEPYETLKFCPYPATWLNREQWADEHEANTCRDMTFEERRQYGRALMEAKGLKVVK